MQPVCSPTRATILTGRHVIHTGVYDPMNGGSGDLSLNFTLLPQHLATLGYSCHMVSVSPPLPLPVSTPPFPY